MAHSVSRPPADDYPPDDKPPRALAVIEERTAGLDFSGISQRATGAFLRTLAAAKPGGAFLELGTGTGAATAWLLDGMDEASRLTTVDHDAALQSVAREALGGDSRLVFHQGDIVPFLRQLAGRRFDLIFADAIPGKYEYLDATLDLVAPGGFYVGDDMLPQPNWPPEIPGLRAVFLENLALRRDFTWTGLGWASGIIMAVRRPEGP